MFHIQTPCFRDWEQGYPPLGAAQGMTPLPGKRLSWRQRLHLWGTERRRARLRGLHDLWDAPHERVWTPTAYSYRDFILQERGAALRRAIYQHLALS